MSFFARQPSVLILSVMVLGAMNAQATQRSGFANHRLSDQYRRHKAQHDHPARTVDVLEEARRTLSNLSPAARRFLFSPTIQNTITNLNSNTNTQGIPTFGDSIESDQKSPQILGYVNPHTGVVEYDLRGHVRKITFLIG